MFLKSNLFGIILCCFSYWCNAQTTLNWEMIHAKSGESIQIGDKGLVQEILYENDYLSDPFYSDNEKDYLWVENYKWEFLSTFDLDLDSVTGRKLELEFPAVDTYAQVFVNDIFVGETDNCFHPFYFLIQDYVKKGINTVKLVFTPPILKWTDKISNADYPLPAPNDAGELTVSPYCRKPPYQFGWDWTLRMNTIGLWKPAFLRIYDDTRYLGYHLETIGLNDSVADLRVDLYFSDTLVENKQFSSDFLGTKELESGNQNFSWTVTINNPKLWWPKEMGTPYQYKDVIRIKSTFGNIDFCDSIKFGIRKSELRRPHDQWGQGYEFYINNAPVFCKGANVIPQEIFPSKINDNTINKLINDANRSNVNMLRVWGGGYYPDDYFYEQCDEKGIMVWQDFMFACAFFNADSIFTKQVSDELKFQIPRISSHPSVVLFNGNNEIEVAWKNWGLQESYNLNQSAQDQIWNDYQYLFHDFIPNLKNEISSIPYIQTSPLSNWGNSIDFNFGSQHYWGLWHGNDSLKSIEAKIGRFNSEFGFQSFPEYSTLLSFSDTASWNLNSLPMKSHQKSYIGSQKIEQFSNQLWGKAKDFKTFIYLSQLTQAEIIGRSIASHRLDYPRCMGTLYWQFNDCWPAPTWSGIDYYGNWKALQYRVELDFEQLTVLRQVEEEKVHYYLSVSNGFLFNVSLNYTIMDLKGKKLKKGRLYIDSMTQKIDLIDFLNYDFKKPHLIHFSWESQNKIGSRDYLENYDQTDSVEGKVVLRLKNLSLENNKAVLVIKNQHFLPYYWIYSNYGKVDFDTNFVHLLPGKHKINIEFIEAPSLKDFNWISLKNAVDVKN
jgi:beta-mannosidase